MAASKSRIDWALLLLRLAVGGLAVFQAIATLRGAHGAITFQHAAAWGLALGELVCGALVLAGLWVAVAGACLAALLGWPLVQAWTHGAGPVAHPTALFRLLTAVACALGGGGRWALER